MANFYYVKEGGTATGNGGRVATTKSTGSFASKGAANYYDDVDNALAATTAPVAGDLILVSNSSANTYSVVPTFTVPDGVQLFSVDDANCNQYAAGASIDNTTSAGVDDGIFINPAQNGWCNWKGFDFITQEALIITVTQEYNVFMEDCSIEKTHVSGGIFASTSSSGGQRSGNLSMRNLTVKGVHESNGIYFAVNFEADNVMPGAGHTLMNIIFLGAASLGNTNAIIKNTDCTLLGISTAEIVRVSSFDAGTVRLERCKIGASQVLHNTIPNACVKVFAHSCDSGDGYYYEYHADFFGQAEIDTTTYLNATYDGTNGFSIQVDTTAEVSITQPFRHKILEIPAQNLSSSQIVTIEATSATANLDDGDWWIELLHNDNTDEALAVRITTQNETAIESNDGTNHSTTGTGTWTLGAANDYIETKSPGALPNVANGLIEVWVCVAKPSITINFDLPTIAAT